MTTIELTPIGVARTPHADPADTPVQAALNRGGAGQIHLDPTYSDALEGLDEFDYIWILAWLDGIAGRIIRFGGVDLVDGTPILDIKPFAGPLDVPPAYPDVRSGWFDTAPLPPSATPTTLRSRSGDGHGESGSDAGG